MSNSKIAVLGHGAWGTAMATVLAHAGHQVRLWCPEGDDAASIRANRVNKRYMPSYKLPDAIEPLADLQEALSDVAYVFVAIPVPFFRSIVQRAHSYALAGQTWISLSKGIEGTTGLLPTDILAQELPSVSIAVLSGPSYADQVMAQQPTGVVVAAERLENARLLCALISTNWFVAYPSYDMIGVQWCGAGKNVLALAIGIMLGAGYSDNTWAMILTSGWRDIMRLAKHFGGRHQTLLGLAGLGDLALTALGQESRNKAFGMALGAGETLEEIFARAGNTSRPEGLNTLTSMHAIITESGCDAPFISALHQYVYGVGITINDLINAARQSLAEGDFS